MIWKKLLLLVNTLNLIHILFSCNSLFENSKYIPVNSFLPNDKNIINSQNLLDEGSSFLNSCDESMISFSSIESIAITSLKELFLLTENNEIIKINKNGEYLFKIDSHGQGPGEIMGSWSIKVRNNNLYILDYENNKILIYTLSGKWIKDIPLRYFMTQCFEVDDEGNIIIPHISFLNKSKEPLFIVINKKGEIEKTIAYNSSIKEDVVNPPPDLSLYLTAERNLLLSFNSRGILYLFNYAGVHIAKFSIQGGPEWKQSVEFVNDLQKEFAEIQQIRIQDVTFDSKGNIYVSWGGEFKGEKTIAAIFNCRGEFTGRLFGNVDYPYPPGCIIMENDSTAWISCNELFTFGKCTLAKRTTE